MTRALSILFMLALLTGCATKGGWPCFSWQKNTDQKNEAAGAEYIKQQSIAATNQPMPMNYNDVLAPVTNQIPPMPGVEMDMPKTVQTAVVRPLRIPLTNGCTEIIWKGMTNIVCPQPAVTNITLTWDWLPGMVYTIQGSSDLTIPKANWPVLGITETNVMTLAVTGAACFYALSAVLK